MKTLICKNQTTQIDENKYLHSVDDMTIVIVLYQLIISLNYKSLLRECNNDALGWSCRVCCSGTN